MVGVGGFLGIQLVMVQDLVVTKAGVMGTAEVAVEAETVSSTDGIRSTVVEASGVVCTA